MTKISKIIAFIVALLIFTGAIFKTNHWPGANIILVVGSSSGIILFLSLLTLCFRKLTTGFGRFNIIFSTLIVVTALLTYMFKLLHWPGAAKMGWITEMGIIAASLVFLVDGILDNDKYTGTIKIIAGFFIVILALVLILI